MANNKLKVKYKDTEIEVNVIYRKRKTITLKIEPKYNITLISPQEVPLKVLEDILIKKREWILQKLHEYKDKDYSDFDRLYQNGEKYYYLGEEYYLEIIQSQVQEVYIKGNKLIVKSKNTNSKSIKSILQWWYKRESQKIVSDRIQHCRKKSEIMNNLTPCAVKVKEQKKRWGTCTSNKDIYINSKISMARIESIDYIIIHEFCHLVHMNHSKEFYSLVERIIPDYKKEVKWLKENSYKLIL